LGKRRSAKLGFMMARAGTRDCPDLLRAIALRHPLFDYNIRKRSAVLSLAADARVVSVQRRFWLVFLAATCALIGSAQPVLHAQATSDEARKLAQDAQQRMRELQAEADRLAAETGTLLGELRKLELERDIRSQAVRKADAELKAVTVQLDQVAARLKRLEAQRVAGTPGVQERLVEIYKRGRGGYVRLMTAADDLRALGRMSRGVAAVAQLDRVRFDDHRRTIRAEQESLRELEIRRAAVSAAQTEAATARRALDAALAAHNRRLDELDARRDLAARYVGELEAAAAELARRADGVTSSAASLPLAPFRGALDWPVPGRLLVSRFGRTTSERLGTVTRNGIEIASHDGQDVHAVHGGTVAFAAPFVGYGNLVILDHGDEALTLYGHLQHLTVSQGERVAKGATVGRAGRNPGGQQVVYFEVRIDGRPVDPVQWLRSSR
jgi:septal ring factor EnvC (AmiA/AmiB activator)